MSSTKENLNSRWAGYSGYRRGLLVALGVFVLNVSILFVIDGIPHETWLQWRTHDLWDLATTLAFLFCLSEIAAVLYINRPRSGPDGATQFFVTIALMPFFCLFPLFLIFFMFVGSST